MYFTMVCRIAHDVGGGGGRKKIFILEHHRVGASKI